MAGSKAEARHAPDSPEFAAEDRPTADEIEQALSRLLDSPDFKATARRKALLKYLVAETLAGRSGALKGYSIGLAVFGRGDDFDSQSDPVVRLEARRLRHDLDSYYVEAGRDDPLRIVVPKGHYIPAFQRQPGMPAAEAASTDDPPIGDSQIRHRLRERTFWGDPRLWLVMFLAGSVIAMLAYRQIPAGHVGPVASEFGPSVTALPFQTQGSDERTAILANGIADQILSELARFPDMRLYLPTRKPAADLSDPVAVGKRVGASFVVAGTVEIDGDLVHTNARLVEIPGGRIVWSRQYENALSDRSLFSIQKTVASDVSTALGQGNGVLQSEMTARLKEPEGLPSMPSYECVLQGYAYRRTFSLPQIQSAQACLVGAVANDPDYAEAWAMLAWTYLDEARFGQDPEEAVQAGYAKALQTAAHALVLDGSNILALRAQASTYHYLGNYEESERIARRALALNPNDPDSMAQLGWRLAIRGNFDEGIPYLKEAIRRTVNPPGWYYHLVAIDDYLHQRYSDMLLAASAGTLDGSGVSWSLVAIADAELGYKEAAGEALAKMKAALPKLATDPKAFYVHHGATEQIADALVAGLAKAGQAPAK